MKTHDNDAERLIIFGILYAMLGVGCAIALLLKQKNRVTDALLLSIFWPLYAPILWLSTQETQTHQKESGLVKALQRAKNSPLAPLLPAAEEIRRLESKFTLAGRKLEEISALLKTPDFSEENAQQRQKELQSRPNTERAQAAVSLRLQNIARLKKLKERFASEQEEIEELLKQLNSQIEVARIAGAHDPSASEFLRELLQRVEVFGQVLEETNDANDSDRR